MWLLERVVDFGGDRHPLDLFGLPAEYLPCKHSRKQRFQESGGYAQRDATSLRDMVCQPSHLWIHVQVARNGQSFTVDRRPNSCDDKLTSPMVQDHQFAQGGQLSFRRP